MFNKMLAAVLLTLSLLAIAPAAKADLEVPSCYPCQEVPLRGAVTLP
jgi:hypothetical protein